jgi:hypothetical protein
MKLGVVRDEMRVTLAIVLICLVCAGVHILMAEEHPETNQWRKVLAFDVMAQQRSHKADIGDHRKVVAGWGELGWEIEVLNYGPRETENLLYNGNNWHGIQPWMVYAWTVHDNSYLDGREVSYDQGRSHLRIECIDCQTRQVGSNSYEFVKGRIEVFHKP